MKIWITFISLFLLAPLLRGAQSAADMRLPIPSAADQAKAERLIHDIFKKEYLDQRNRLTFAATLLKNAIETKDDNAAKYILFRESRDQAILAAELAPAITAADALAANFAVDRDETRLDAIRRAWSAGPVNAAVAKPFIDLCMKSSDQSAREEHFSAAVKYSGLAEEFARTVRDQPALARVRTWSALLRDAAADAEKARAALAKLDSDPSSAEAKAAIARWLCCWRGDWDNGLAFLADNSDRAMAQIAQRDIRGATDSTGAMEIASGWWSLSEKIMRPWNSAARDRAAYWYGKAAPLLGGLQKALAEKRISEAAELSKREQRLVFNPESFATKRTEKSAKDRK